MLCAILEFNNTETVFVALVFFFFSSAYILTEAPSDLSTKWHTRIWQWMLCFSKSLLTEKHYFVSSETSMSTVDLLYMKQIQESLLLSTPVINWFIISGTVEFLTCLVCLKLFNRKLVYVSYVNWKNNEVFKPLRKIDFDKKRNW